MKVSVITRQTLSHNVTKAQNSCMQSSVKTFAMLMGDAVAFLQLIEKLPPSDTINIKKAHH